MLGVTGTNDRLVEILDQESAITQHMTYQTFLTSIAAAIIDTCGPPGTGKSTVMRNQLYLSEASPANRHVKMLQIYLAAQNPTVHEFTIELYSCLDASAPFIGAMARCPGRMEIQCNYRNTARDAAPRDIPNYDVITATFGAVAGDAAKNYSNYPLADATAILVDESQMRQGNPDGLVTMPIIYTAAWNHYSASHWRPTANRRWEK